MTSELEIRKAMCDVGRRMYEKNLVAATDGNISVKLGPDRFLCTPSGVSKGFMAPNEMVLADSKGNKLGGDGRVTTEFFTHLAVYEEREDVGAVVHAHPPRAIGFTLAGRSLSSCVLPEVVMALGGIPTTEYATPASKEGSIVIREYIRNCDAVLMDRHGAVTAGRDVYDAYYKMEKLEHAAETLLTASLLGEIRTLEAEEVHKLFEARKTYGVSGKAYKCNIDGCADPEEAEKKAQDPVLDKIVAETLRALGRS